MITITVLAENTARGAGILGEHGLAFWIETGTQRVLFDTGQGMALVPNAARLGIDLATADAIVLSHGHFDHVGGLEAALAQPDPLLDDQALYLPTAQGVIVIFGCAHSGAINTLRHIASLTGDTRIRLLLGGLHLESAAPRRMEETVRALRVCRPQKMGFCHCTGLPAIRRLWDEFPDACLQAHAGLRLELAD